MKRLLSFLIMFFLLSATVVVFASSSNTYSIDELDMSIDIPSEYVVFTRNISDDDPNLSVYGISKNALLEMMESKNIYLNAWDNTVGFEIIVTMIQSSLSNFKDLSDSTLNFLASSISPSYADLGIALEKYEIFRHDQTKFIKLYISQPNGTGTAYGLQYYTVYNNMAINVTIQSYTGRIDSEKESILKSIVNTVYFNNAPILTDTVQETPSFLYTDEETDATFIVPANWCQKALTQDREILDVKFLSNHDASVSILYGSTDMWSEMSPREQRGLSRSDVNNSMLSKNEIAATIGIDSNAISIVSYGGNDYYKYKTTTVSTVYGIDIEVVLTCFMRVENGYAFVFQFSGDDKSPYYKDFESLLESVKYPPVTESSSTTNKLFKFSVVNIIISLLITSTVYSLPIIIYRYGILKEPVEKARAKKITIIYGIIAFVLMSIILFVVNGNVAVSGAILLWSWINYQILVGGSSSCCAKAPTIVATDNNHLESLYAFENTSTVEVPTIDTSIKAQNECAEEVVYCYKCGTKLNKSNTFCHKCGTKILK